MNKIYVCCCFLIVALSEEAFSSELGIEHKLTFTNKVISCAPSNIPPINFFIDYKNLNPKSKRYSVIDRFDGVISFSDCPRGQILSVMANDIFDPVPGSPISLSEFDGDAKKYFAIANIFGGEIFSNENNIQQITLGDDGLVPFRTMLLILTPVSELKYLKTGRYRSVVSYTVTLM